MREIDSTRQYARVSKSKPELREFFIYGKYCSFWKALMDKIQWHLNQQKTVTSDSLLIPLKRLRKESEKRYNKYILQNCENHS